MPKIKVSPLTFLALFPFLYFTPVQTSVNIILACAFHEAGHLLAIVLCNNRVESICFSPMGITINRRGGAASYLHDIFIYSMGPAFSFILAVICFFFSAHNLAMISISLFAINIVPIKIFDGGKILYSILCIFIPNTAQKTVNCISGSVICVLWILSIYVILVTGENFSLFAMCIYLFFSVFI